MLFAGQGYVTVRFKEIRTSKSPKGGKCDPSLVVWSTCDPVAKLFINGREYPTNIARSDTKEFKTNVIVTSEKVGYHSDIEILIADDNGDKKSEMLMQVKGNVNDFLARTFYIHPSKYVNNYFTYAVFWKDLYNYEECSNEEDKVQKYRNKCQTVKFVGQY